jgi:quercetin dioxygenase-like cupin family protein
VAASSVATGQNRPARTQGLEDARLQQFPLPTQISSGYELRARRIVFAPGGTVVEHSHAERPGVVYVLEGSMIEHRGETARVVKAGDTWVEDANTVHWLENRGDAPCVFLSVDLIKK